MSSKKERIVEMRVEKNEGVYTSQFIEKESFAKFIKQIEFNLLKINERLPDKVAVLIYADGKCTDIDEWVAEYANKT